MKKPAPKPTRPLRGVTSFPQKKWEKDPLHWVKSAADRAMQQTLAKEATEAKEAKEKKRC